MKKVMFAAALAALTSGVYAATLTPIDCEEDLPESTCDVLVFKLTASGKTVQDVNDGAYKAVKALKVSKGALAFLYNEECAEEGACCYETVNLYAAVKVGSKTTKIAMEELTIGKWSIFGKNFEAKVRDYLHTMKKGSSTSVESDLFISSASAPGDGEIEVLVDGADEDAEAPAVDIWAAAFGTMTAKLSKGKSGSNAYCDPEDTPECVLNFTPKSYNGWFVGTRDLISDGWCFNCACGEYDIFGGTWKAVYQAKYKTVEGAQKLAFGKVLFDGEDE